MGELIAFGIVCGIIYWCYQAITEWLQNSDSKSTYQSTQIRQNNTIQTTNTAKTFDNYKVSTRDIDIELLDAKDLQTIQRCLTDGADINTRDRDGNTILLKHSKQGDLEIVKLLIKNGADVNAKDKYGWTRLMSCSDLETAKLLVENGADVNARDEVGKTPLIHCRNLEVAKYLIECGADIEAKDKWGDTALIKASGGCLDSVKILVEAGANVNLDTALIKACWHIKEEQYLERSSERETRQTYFEIIKYLASKGADINANDGKALIQATNSGKATLVKLLVELGADVNIKDNNGKTALHYACSSGERLDGVRLDVVKILVEKGANINAVYESGRTALLYVCKSGSPYSTEIVEYLVSKGADVNAKGVWKSPLHYTDVTNIKEILIKAGASLDYCSAFF